MSSINTTKTSPALSSIREEFGTREGTNLEKVTAYLHARKNKPVKLDELAKAVYKSATKANRMKVKMVVVGLNMTIEAYELPYAKVVFTGRGEDATLTLASKSAKVSKAAKKAA
jgi:hypothetical protein